MLDAFISSKQQIPAEQRPCWHIPLRTLYNKYEHTLKRRTDRLIEFDQGEG